MQMMHDTQLSNCEKTEFIGFTKIFPWSSHFISPLLSRLSHSVSFGLRNWKLNALIGAFCILHCAPTRHREIYCADNKLSDQEMTSSRSVNSTACNVEIFCHMLFEEFLITNNMQSTLQAFRQEWERPAEVPSAIDICRSGVILWTIVKFHSRRISLCSHGTIWFWNCKYQTCFTKKGMGE